MTTVVGVGMVALFLALPVGALATSAILIACLWRWARRADPFEPQAAEAPERVFAGQFDAQGDLLAPPDYQPSVAAGSDLDDSKLVGEIYQAIDLYKRGGNIESGAPKEQA